MLRQLQVATSPIHLAPATVRTRDLIGGHVLAQQLLEQVALGGFKPGINRLEVEGG